MVDKGLIDNRERMKELDKQGVLASVEKLPDQIKDAWDGVKQLKDQFGFDDFDKVVLFGMGGSALGGWVIKRLYPDLKVPFEVVSDYQVPGYVDDKTLVILSSYSGNTEEVLEAADKVKDKTNQIMVITTGGKLLDLAKEQRWPVYVIDPVHNPSNQPRMAVGYAITGLLAMFKSVGLLNVKDEEINEVVEFLKQKGADLVPEASETNIAKYLAYAAYRRIMVLISAQHLLGGVHVFNNQVNENAKNLTIELPIPEMNHHYLEALPFPKQLKDDVVFFGFDSKLYSDRIRQRLSLTGQLIEKAGYPYEIIRLEADSKLTQVFEMIQIGAFVSFYLAMLNGIDPSPIPNVDFLKSELAKLKTVEV